MADKTRRAEIQARLDALLASEEPNEEKELLRYLEEIAQCYKILKQYKMELPFRERLVKIAPTSPYHNNLGVVYSNLHQHRAAMEQYLKAIEYPNASSMPYHNFMHRCVVGKIFDEQLLHTYHDHTYAKELEVIVSFAKTCLQEGHSEFFAFTDRFTISDSCPDYNSNFIVKAIFDTTRRLKNRCQVRIRLLDLYDKVLTIKNEQKIDLEQEDLEICHYTRVENLKHLIKPGSTPAYLRLFNAAYMNDPSEGKVFDRLMLRCSGCEMRQSDSDHHRGNRLYHSYGYSSTYLGSFSASVDSLPMWVQYGNGGLGCCLIFDTDFFDKDEPFGDPESLGLAVPDSEEQAASAEVKEKERYVLYKVEYISEDGDYRHKDILCHIAELYHEIDGLTDRLAQSSKEKIRRIADNILDQIRFLFKEEDYAHEREYRVVKSSFAPLCDEGARSGEVPHLYIEFKRPLRYKEVILGPKVKDPSEVAPYLHYTGKVKRITKSLVKYQ